jgi:aspartyl/asparaginyl-tRNA synthetase
MAGKIDLRRRMRIADAQYGEVVLAGFVQDIRVLKNIAFIVLRDLSGVVQIVFKRGSIPDEMFEEACSI